MVEGSTPKSILSTSEVSFPRGGKGGLSALEVKEVSNEATRDVLFEVAAQANKRAAPTKSGQPKKKQKLSKTSQSKKQEGVDDEEEAVTIEHFNFKNLIPGTSVLGQVSSIGKLELALAIGDNLVGYIPITSISPEITLSIEKYEAQQQEKDENDDDDEEAQYENDDDENPDKITQASLPRSTFQVVEEEEFPELRSIFQVGQWLRAAVVRSDNEKNQKRIQLSIEPEATNKGLEDEDLIPNTLLQASIKSIEDHGAILNTGFSNLTGFVSNKELKNANIEPESLKSGGVILTSIVSSPKNRTITLRPVNGAKKTAVTTISSVDSILPGIYVDALISEVTKDGIVAKVFGLVEGTIILPHLSEYEFLKLKHKYTVGNNIKTRILGVLLKAGTKKLILSQLPHVINFGGDSSKEALEAFPISHTFNEGVEIKAIDSSYIYVSVGGGLQGQVHLSKIDKSKTIEDYNVGSKPKARILGFNPIDNLLVLTFDPEIVNAKYLSIDEVPIGTLVPGCEVVEVLPEGKGIKVKAFGFDAFVPSNSMSDIKLIYPERKFRVGSKVKARALRIHGKQLLVTFKRSLVNVEDDVILSQFDKATIGMKTPATVEKFVHGGAIVSFFGNVRAFLPKNEISETFVNEARDHLKLNQTITVRIVNINKEDKRLVVSLRQSDELSTTQHRAISLLENGKTVVDAFVVEKQNETIIVEIEGMSLRGVLYSGHLSDGNYEQNRALFKRLPVGDKIQVVTLEKDLKARTVIVSAKKSLIEAAKSDQLPALFKDVEVSDRKLYGFVKSVTNMGLFVSFAGKLTGLVLAKYATDKPNDDLSKKFHKYQSISCHVIRVDEENKRFLLSLKQNSSTTPQSEAPLENPIDSSKKYISDYVVGGITKAEIKSVKGTQLNVQLADNLQGRVDITECFKSYEEIKDKRQPLSQFHKNEIIDVKVIGYHDAKTHKFLPITHKKSNKHTILELSLGTTKNNNEGLKLSDLKAGEECLAFVNNIANSFVWVSLTPTIKGRISLMDLTDDTTLFDDLENKLPIGSSIKATIKDIDIEHHTVTLIARENTVSSISDLKVGNKYPCKIVKVKESFVLVSLGNELLASSFITDALNDYSEKLADVFKVNSFATATVLAIDEDDKKIAVSLRTGDATDKCIDTIDDLTRGQVVRGFVKNTANNGLFVSLGRSVHALVRVSDLSDEYLKDWKKYYKQHQFVVGKIASCKEEGRVLMTLKNSEVKGDLNVLKKFEDLVVGDIFNGSVKRVTDFGVFVRLDDTVNVTGLCHHSQISDNKISDISALFGEGDRVKVKIMAIDEKKKQLSLGMKASFFTTQQNSESEDEDAEMAEEDEDEDGDDEDEDEVMVDAFENASDEEDEEEDDEEEETSPSKTGLTGLSTSGFDWTASILDQAENDDSSSDEEDFILETKSRKRSKKLSYVEDKTADLNTRAPQSVSDFERLLVGNPNSSILWMNYMSFQLQLSEIDKAREIGERALKIINYREEQEKMNIWIALLNLENTFGDDESLESTFKRACQYMDSMTMHLKLVAIYTLSEKYDKADDLYKTMTKKFGKTPSIWVLFGSYLLDRERRDDLHETLAKALQVLPKRDHIEVVRKYAQLEFAKGDAEQARSLFEGLVSDAPKKIDLWNVYIDQEIKHGGNVKTKVEHLFERVFTHKINRKQAKFFFNKWLAYEEEHGDEAGAARVKAKAVEFVQSTNEE